MSEYLQRQRRIWRRRRPDTRPSFGAVSTARSQNAGLALEEVADIGLVGETELGCDILDGSCRSFQVLARFLDNALLDQT